MILKGTSENNLRNSLKIYVKDVQRLKQFVTFTLFIFGVYYGYYTFPLVTHPFQNACASLVTIHCL